MLPVDLISQATSDGKVTNLPWSQGRSQITDVIGRAFCGTATTPAEAALHWSLGPELTTPDDPERNDVGRFCMEMGLCTRGPLSTTLAARDGAGNIAAVAVVQKLGCAPPESTCMDAIRIIATVVPMVLSGKMPKALQSDPGVQRRGSLLTPAFARLHETHADFPHIYLVMIGTDPPHQGKGHGAALLRAVNCIADVAGVPVYLETGPANRSLYEHFGFAVVGETTICEKTDEGEVEGATPSPVAEGMNNQAAGATMSSWSPLCPYLAMVRQPSR